MTHSQCHCKGKHQNTDVKCPQYHPTLLSLYGEREKRNMGSYSYSLSHRQRSRLNGKLLSVSVSAVRSCLSSSNTTTFSPVPGSGLTEVCINEGLSFPDRPCYCINCCSRLRTLIVNTMSLYPGHSLLDDETLHLIAIIS